MFEKNRAKFDRVASIHAAVATTKFNASWGPIYFENSVLYLFTMSGLLAYELISAKEELV